MTTNKKKLLDAFVCTALLILSVLVYFSQLGDNEISIERLSSGLNPNKDFMSFLAVISSIFVGYVLSKSVKRSYLKPRKFKGVYLIVPLLVVPITVYTFTIFLSILVLFFIPMCNSPNPLPGIWLQVLTCAALLPWALFSTPISGLFLCLFLFEFMLYSSVAVIMYFSYLRITS